MTEVTNTIEDVIFAFRARVTEGNVIEFVNLPVLKSITFLGGASGDIRQFTIKDCPELVTLDVKEYCFTESGPDRRMEISNCPKFESFSARESSFFGFTQLILLSEITTGCLS